MNFFSVAFFGHRYICNQLMLMEELEKHIKSILDENEYVEFLVAETEILTELLHQLSAKLKEITVTITTQ